MTDAFESLRLPLVPVEPDPRFARRLRARLVDALAPSRGAVMADVTDPTRTLETIVDDAARELVADVAAPTADIAAGAAIPYLAVADARAAIDWYRRVLGARLMGEPIIMDDGRVGHAELSFTHGLLYLADEFPDIGVAAPDPRRAAVSLVLDVPDVDASVAAAVASGAELTRPVYEAYGHRGGTIVDPFGHRWMLQTPTPPSRRRRSRPTRYGPVTRSTRRCGCPMPTAPPPSSASVLGWSSSPAAAGHARQVEGTTPAQGIHGGRRAPLAVRVLRHRRPRRRRRAGPGRRRSGRGSRHRGPRPDRRLHRRSGGAVRAVRTRLVRCRRATAAAGSTAGATAT